MSLDYISKVYRRAAVISLLVVLPVALSQEINWYSIDNGGGVVSANNIELLGVIGQTDTNQMSGDNIILSGGYLPLPDTRDVIFEDSFE